MRSMWKGAISFGLVNIPVQLYAATEERAVRFNQLHKVCHTPVKYRKFCPTCGVEVQAEEIVRGFAYDADRYVIVEDEDLAALPLPTLRTIEILSFVRLSEIDPLQFEKAYYIEPQERADKAYGLLHRALSETGRIGVAKVALRIKESLAAVRSSDKMLVLHLMHFPDEIRATTALRGTSQAPPPSETELRVAKQLIESLSVPFDPSAYRDEYREALLQRIEEKAAGERGAVRPQLPGDARVDDLLAALEASLQEVRKAGAAPVPVP